MLPHVLGCAVAILRSAERLRSSSVTRRALQEPLITWTPLALESNARERRFRPWRVVEAQHIAATMQLVDSSAEQAVLESILEHTKPKLPEGCEKLHYLLSTPFRYRSRVGSRFRAAFESGVWYGGEQLRTALAEKSYWQLRFLLDSPQMPDLKPITHTAFRATVRGNCIDLTQDPFAQDRTRWTHRTEYGATQALAALARASKVQLIRYESVRDPRAGFCIAALSCAAFERTQPLQQQTWFIAASREHVRCTQAGQRDATWDFEASQLIG